MLTKASFSLLCLSLITLATGCSNHDVYDMIQANHASKCDKLPNSSLYEECIQNQGPNYTDYAAERDALLRE